MNLHYGASMHHFFSKHRQIVKLKRESRKKQQGFKARYLISVDPTKLEEVMEFQLSYFKSKMMLLKFCTQYASKFGKLSSGHRTGKGQFSFQSQRMAMPKNVQTTTQLHSSHMLAK